MSLRIACDLDGTLADMESALQREAERLFGPGVHLRGGTPLPRAALESPSPVADSAARGDTAEVDDAPPAPERRTLTDQELRQMWAHVGGIDAFWSGLDEIEPGSVARLAALAARRRWEVIFVTQRPAGAGPTPQLQTQQWLRARGFELPSVFVMQGSRGRLAEALDLDAVIDDRPDNCLDVVTESTARAILVWRDDPAAVPPGARRVGIVVTASFGEALNQLERLEQMRAKSGGLVGRIRNAIGI